MIYPLSVLQREYNCDIIFVEKLTTLFGTKGF